ncbi:MAG: tryptophan--tRNA ligase [Ruminococcaceae bacterium]|nr:tryptophan--tRNA ligase [Oscillospiraceae bacterium]
MENTAEKKKILFSGIQPTGRITLGNYLGAVRNWRLLEDTYDCLYSVVDLHAITVRQDPAALRKQCLSTLALLLASGLSPEKSILFFQSHVAEHAELAWVLNCYTMFGELSRMTQFKDKSAKHADNINAGLFAYPALMAADILLYKTEMVPVGQDQKQHLELARNIAERFNGIYGDTFVVPEPYIPKVGAKIASLAEPTKKMSKSDPNENSFVALLDKPDDIMRKFKRAVTDSEAVVRYAEGKDGINNLMTIYGSITGKSFEEIEREFDGRGYGDFKAAVGEVVVNEFAPIREKHDQLLNDKAYLESVYKQGAEKASYMARKTLAKVYKKLGYVAK